MSLAVSALLISRKLARSPTFSKISECFLFWPFSKNGLTTGFLSFKSFPPDTFWCSLQSKETHKGSSPTRLILLGVLCWCKERLKDIRFFALKTEKTGSGTAALLLWSPFLSSKKPEKTWKAPKGRKKTWKVMVYFSGFFYGCGGGIFHCPPQAHRSGFSRA